MKCEFNNVSIIRLRYNVSAMRAIYLFFILIIFSSCASVEVAKEVTKAASSIKTSVVDLVESKKPKENEKKESLVEIQKKQVGQEKEKEDQVVLKQKKIANINLIGKTIKELKKMIGSPALVRIDDETTTIRYDSTSCKIFVFMNNSLKKSKVEYYELRDSQGNLIDRETDIKSCFNEIKNV